MSQPKTNNKTKILTWSGGPDSTACLIDLLQYTDDPVITYHFQVIPGDLSTTCIVDLDSLSNDLDYQAVQDLTPILKQQYRDFEVRHIKVVTPQDPEVFREMGLFPVVETINVQGEFYEGWCADEAHEGRWACFGTPVYFFTERRDQLQSTAVPIIKYNQHKTKKQIRKELGEKIWKLTWSCVNPTSNKKPCGVCSKCKVNKSSKTTKKKKSSTKTTN